MFNFLMRNWFKRKLIDVKDSFKMDFPQDRYFIRRFILSTSEARKNKLILMCILSAIVYQYHEESCTHPELVEDPVLDPEAYGVTDADACGDSGTPENNGSETTDLENGDTVENEGP